MAQPQFEPFGNYLLLHKIAVGGMAEIYLAIDQRSRDREIVVIKRIRRDLGGNKEFVEMFLDEAEVIRRLDHPNIIRLLDCGQVDGRYYIALEHVWGESLGQLSRMCLQQHGRFPLAPALWVGIEVAHGLEHAHAHLDPDGTPSPVIHRDVTTENVAISYQGDVKVLDFGIAKAKDRLARTRIGQIKGTLSYLAPEQLLGEEASPQTDVYQLGAMLYQTLLGRLPVDGKNALELMKAIVGNQIVKPSTVVPGFPERVERTLLRAMAREPDQRFAGATEVGHALRQLLGSAYAEGRTRLVQFIAKVSGDRQVRQQVFIDNVLQGLQVNRQVGDLFDWAAGDEAKTVTDATAGADVRAAIERDEIEATDPTIASPYAVGDERTDRSESPALTVVRRAVFPELETVSLRSPPEDPADRDRDTITETVGAALPPARDTPYAVPGEERSGDFEVFSSGEAPYSDRSVPAPVTMPNLSLPRVVRDETAGRDDLAAAEGRGATGERLFNELLRDAGARVVVEVPSQTPLPPPDVPIEDRPTMVRVLGPEMLGETKVGTPAAAADEVIELDRPKPPIMAAPIVELRVRKDTSVVPGGSARGEPSQLPYELPASGSVDYDLAAIATALDEEAIELSEFSRLARTQRAGWWSAIATFGGVLGIAVGLLLAWPLLNRRSEAGLASRRAAITDAAVSAAPDAASAAATGRDAARDAGQRTGPALVGGRDASVLERARATARGDASAARSKGLGKLLVDAGSESAITFEGRGINGRSSLSLQQSRGRIYLTRVANDLEVRLDYEVVGDEIRLQLDTTPATDVSYNGFAVGPTPRNLVLGNQFHIMLSASSLAQPFKLDVKFEVAP